jgi:uncharacterized YigZ family protein
MDEDMYRTIATPSEGIFKSKGSRFLAFAYPVKDLVEIKDHIHELKNIYHDARHHCYAYVLGTKAIQYRAYDDREPSGTAGKPILTQIHSLNLTFILVIVVRYFGGTLLGTAGLIEAYKTAAHEALSNSIIINKTENQTFSIKFEYEMMNELLHIIKEEKVEVTSKEFVKSGTLQLAIRQSRAKAFVNRLKQLNGITFLE